MYASYPAGRNCAFQIYIYIFLTSMRKPLIIDNASKFYHVSQLGNESHTYPIIGLLSENAEQKEITLRMFVVSIVGFLCNQVCLGFVYVQLSFIMESY